MLLITSICGNSKGPSQLQSSQWDQLRPLSQWYHSSTPPLAQAHYPHLPTKCSKVHFPVNLLHANLYLRFWRCLQETWLATTNHSSPFPLNKYSNFSFSQRQIPLTTRHLVLCIYWKVDFDTNFSSIRRTLKLSWEIRNGTKVKTVQDFSYGHMPELFFISSFLAYVSCHWQKKCQIPKKCNKTNELIKCWFIRFLNLPVV